MAKSERYPEKLYVKVVDSGACPVYQGRVDKNHLPIGDDLVRIAEYKLVRQIEVRREVVDHAEIG